MIYSLHVKNPETTVCEWWPKVDGLKDIKKLGFKPGLNILWGRNGTGKSTLLTAMARYLHCEQGGRPIITTSSCQAIFRSFSHDKWQRRGLAIEHDGQGTFYVNPGRTIGHLGGGFDDDFFMEGVQSAVAKGSAGQTTLIQAGMVLKHAKRVEVECRIPESINDVWKKFRGEALRMTKGTTDKKGPPTILLDEPDRSLDIDNTQQLWASVIPSMVKTRQVIVATHSPFALNMAGANYIVLGEQEYLAKCREAVKSLPGV